MISKKVDLISIQAADAANKRKTHIHTYMYIGFNSNCTDRNIGCSMKERGEKKEKEYSLLAVDHLARGSMKNAASCDK